MSSSGAGSCNPKVPKVSYHSVVRKSCHGDNQRGAICVQSLTFTSDQAALFVQPAGSYSWRRQRNLTAVLAVSLRLHECDAHEADSTSCHQPERDPVNNPASPCRRDQSVAGLLRHGVNFNLSWEWSAFGVRTTSVRDGRRNSCDASRGA